MQYIKICVACGIEFIATRTDARVCSKHCNKRIPHLTHRKATSRLCEQCGKEIWVEPNQLARSQGRFCSRDCKNIWQSIHIRGEAHPNYRIEIHPLLSCTTCGKQFRPRLGTERTCSRDCGAIFHGRNSAGARAHQWTGGEDRICPTCKKSFHVPHHSWRKIYCSRHCARKASRASHYQTQVYEWAKTILGPELVMEQTFNWLRSDRNRCMYLDIYDPQRHLAIEVDGRHHYDDKAFANGLDGLLRTKRRDSLKNQLCKDHHITLIRLSGNLSQAKIDKVLSTYI